MILGIEEGGTKKEGIEHMCTTLRQATVFALALLVGTSAASAGIAVTEFLNNAEGEDSGREWIELYNYGMSAVTLNGWTLADEDSDAITIPTMTIASGDYAILASGGSDLDAAQAKAVFEAEWLGGIADARVFGVTTMALGNSDDELILSDGVGTVWNLAYGNDENDNATYLTGAGDAWTRTDWGTKDGVQILRQGDDLGIPGLLGFELNNSPVGGPLDPGDDLFAYESDYLAIKDAGFLASIGLATDFYDNVDNGSWGSPLAGAYVPVPEPAALTVLVLGSLVVLRRR